MSCSATPLGECARRNGKTADVNPVLPWFAATSSSSRWASLVRFAFCASPRNSHFRCASFAALSSLICKKRCCCSCALLLASLRLVLQGSDGWRCRRAGGWSSSMTRPSKVRLGRLLVRSGTHLFLCLFLFVACSRGLPDVARAQHAVCAPARGRPLPKRVPVVPG